MEFINTNVAPKPVGPYSQAVKAGRFLFVSGQVAIDPKTGKIIDGAVKGAYGEYFEQRFPTRATVGIQFMPKALVEISVTAYKD